MILAWCIISLAGGVIAIISVLFVYARIHRTERTAELEPICRSCKWLEQEYADKFHYRFSCAKMTKGYDHAPVYCKTYIKRGAKDNDS